MKRSCLLLVAAGLVLAASGHAARADVTYSVTYNGANERPTPTNSSATAIGTFTYETAKNDILYSVSYFGLSGSAQAAHLHIGSPGGVGPIILPMLPNPTGTSGVISGTLTNADLINQAISGVTDISQVNAIGLANGIYANLHSTAFPGGEIRGQLIANALAVPEPASITLLALGLIGMLTLQAKKER